MMDRRAFVAGSLSLLAAPLAGEAQQGDKVRRIGYLTPTGLSSAGIVPLHRVFDERLRELGWVVGQNLAIEYRAAEGQPDRLPGLAAELVRLSPEVIVAVAGQAPLALKNATRTIPILALYVSNPVALGLVASHARPGGNVTAITDPPEVVGKALSS
jgi:putative tryptophan/tyrosine transport system substrate-binding protein